MSGVLSRRMALKAIAAAPLAAQKAAETAVGAEVLATAAVDTAAMSGLAPASGIYGQSTQMLALSQLAKAGLLPDWARRQMVRAQARMNRALEPDVACLQSVSLGSKIRISGERRYDRALDAMEEEALDTQFMAEFFGWNRPVA